MLVHRRGAETTEATQRRERMEWKRMWVETLSSSQFFYLSASLFSALPLWSLRLCGEQALLTMLKNLSNDPIVIFEFYFQSIYLRAIPLEYMQQLDLMR